MQNFVNNDNNPTISYNGQYDDPAQNAPFNRVTHPSDKPTISKHIFAIDSRQRNYDFYPEANNYTMAIPDRYRNVTAIELKAATLPRTEYNVNNSNNHIDYCIGDFIYKISTVGNSHIKIKGKPYGKQSGVKLNIDEPTLPGTKAVIEVDIDINSNIIPNSYNIINPGSGYLQSKPPRASLGDYTNFNIVIGFNYTAKLREGQYVIGGNPQFTDNKNNDVHQSWVPSNLLCEVENAMSYSILEDATHCYSRTSWTSNSTAPTSTDKNDRLLLFTARLMSQYPTLDTYTGKRTDINNFETNSCKFNRIYLSNCLIFKSTNLPIGGFKDSNFNYNILKYKQIPGSDEYILYCELDKPLSVGNVSGKYWDGLTNDIDVQTYNIKLVQWEILNATGEFNLVNSSGLLGFSKQNQYKSTHNNSIEITHINSNKTTTLIPSALTYSSQNDYYLFGDPEYIVLSFKPKYGGNTISGINDRVDSQPSTNIDRVFACLIYDTVQPAVLQDVSSGKLDSTIGSLADNNNGLGTFMNYDSINNEVKQLTGNSGTQNVSYNKHPGQLKAMKGADFDRKIVEFPQPVAQIFDIAIKFTKFTKLDNNSSDSDLYNFHGKEHLLLFEITCSDLMTGKRF